MPRKDQNKDSSQDQSTSVNNDQVGGQTGSIASNLYLFQQQNLETLQESDEYHKDEYDNLLLDAKEMFENRDTTASEYSYSWFQLQDLDLGENKDHNEKAYEIFRQKLFEDYQKKITKNEVVGLEPKLKGLDDSIDLWTFSPLQGTPGFNSDIDANVSGPASGVVIYLLNKKFKEDFSGHDSGMVLDLNFYAEGHLPQGLGDTIRDSVKGVGGQDENQITIEEWNPELLAMWENYKQADMDDQLRASYLLLWESEHGGPEAVKSLLKNNKTLLTQVEAEMAQNKGMRDAVKAKLLGESAGTVTISKVNIDNGIEFENLDLFGDLELSDEDKDVAQGLENSDDSESEMALKIKIDTIIYETILRKLVTPAEIDYLKYKGTSHAPGAYFNLRKVRTLSERFSNESYATEGGVVGVVMNKQAGSTMFQPDDKRTVHHKNIELTTDQYFHMANEQFGFAHHHIGNLDNLTAQKQVEELVTTGKYMHRYTNAVKYLFNDDAGPKFGELLPKGYKFNEQWGKAGGLWEHLKKAGDNPDKIKVLNQKWKEKMGVNDEDAEVPETKEEKLDYLIKTITGADNRASFAAKFQELHHFVTSCYLDYRTLVKAQASQ